MSKIKNVNLNLNTFKQASTTTSKQTTSFTSNNQAIVSIVNQSNSSCMASSFDDQCSIVKQQANNSQLPQLKKKRAALENISNANSGSNAPTAHGTIIDAKAQLLQQQQQSQHHHLSLNNLNQTCANNTTSSNSNKSELVQSTSFKKSRFGNSVFGTQSTTTNANQIVTKSFLPTKKSTTTKASSKENLTTIPGQNIKCEPKDVKKRYIIAKTSSLRTTNTNLEQQPPPQFNEPQKIKIETELNIEHQLATTTISANDIELSLKSETDEQQSNDVDLVQELTAELVDGWEDIDAADEHDEFSASDYVQQIFKYYRQREDKFEVQDYLKNQPHINKQMRLLLVDWMVEVQQQLEFNHEVLYLSVKLLDLYLNQKRIEKEKLQLLGGAAMFIACKFEERMPPIIDDFIYVSDNAYDRKELIKMEIEILKTVKFDIGIPLSYTFLRRYSKCIRADMKFLTLARYILELSLQDYSFAYIKDSLKACAALYLALKMSVQYEKNVGQQMMDNEQQSAQLQQLTVSTANLTSTEWNETLIHYTGSFLKDFIHLVPQMNNLIKTAAQSKYKTIFKKYSHQVFYEVATIAPLSESEMTLLIENCNTSSIGAPSPISK